MMWLWLLRFLQRQCRHPETVTLEIDSAPTRMEYCRICGARRWIWPRRRFGLWQRPSGEMRDVRTVGMMQDEVRTEVQALQGPS